MSDSLNYVAGFVRAALRMAFTYGESYCQKEDSETFAEFEEFVKKVMTAIKEDRNE